MVDELQKLRENLAREQELLEGKNRELRDERRRMDEERKALEARLRNAENLAREQEILDKTSKELGEERRRIDEEKKVLEANRRDVEDGRIKYITLKMRNELRSERVELNRLKKSLQQLRADNLKERKRLEKERAVVLKARARLENERRKITQKAAFLRMRRVPVGLFEALSESQQKKKHKVEGEESSSQLQADVKAEKPPPTESVRVENAPQENLMVLGMRLGEQDYGIDIREVREIIRKHEITPIPRQPPYVEGVMNVRGTIIPVVNLKKRFGLQGETSTHPHTVIVESEEGPVGMLVDQVSEVIRVPVDRIHPPPAVTSGVSSEYLRGICRVGEGLLIFLDVKKVLKQGTPIDRISAGLKVHLSPEAERQRLERDERRVFNAINKTGRSKTGLKEKVGFGAAKLDRLIASLARKGLVQVSTQGSRKLISRIDH
jgi:purine-binding chemotaxis protein CheW